MNPLEICYAIARGLGGDVRAAAGCLTPRRVCPPVCISPPRSPSRGFASRPPGPLAGPPLSHPAAPIQTAWRRAPPCCGPPRRAGCAARAVSRGRGCWGSIPAAVASPRLHIPGRAHRVHSRSPPRVSAPTPARDPPPAPPSFRRRVPPPARPCQCVASARACPSCSFMTPSTPTAASARWRREARPSAGTSSNGANAWHRPSGARCARSTSSPGPHGHRAGSPCPWPPAMRTRVLCHVGHRPVRPHTRRASATTHRLSATPGGVEESRGPPRCLGRPRRACSGRTPRRRRSPPRPPHAGVVVAVDGIQHARPPGRREVAGSPSHGPHARLPTLRLPCFQARRQECDRLGRAHPEPDGLRTRWTTHPVS